MLRTYRAARLAAAFVLTVGIMLPVVQMACAMGGHAMDSSSMETDHDHHSREMDLDCERPPDCCAESEAAPLPEACDDCLQEVLVLNRTPVLSPVDGVELKLFPADVDPIFQEPVIDDLIALSLVFDSEPIKSADSIQVLYSIFLL